MPRKRGMILRAVTGAKGPGAPPPGRAPDLPKKTKKQKILQAAAAPCRILQKKYGRGDWIRTSGPYVPNVLLYQTEPHLVDELCRFLQATYTVYHSSEEKSSIFSLFFFF